MPHIAYETIKNMYREISKVEWVSNDLPNGSYGLYSCKDDFTISMIRRVKDGYATFIHIYKTGRVYEGSPLKLRTLRPTYQVNDFLTNIIRKLLEDLGYGD